jgi:inhibitor of KinA sporulation pathway (predicted exonuclease)
MFDIKTFIDIMRIIVFCDPFVIACILSQHKQVFLTDLRQLLKMWRRLTVTNIRKISTAVGKVFDSAEHRAVYDPFITTSDQVCVC